MAKQPKWEPNVEYIDAEPDQEWRWEEYGIKFENIFGAVWEEMRFVQKRLLAPLEPLLLEVFYIFQHVWWYNSSVQEIQPQALRLT